MTTLERRFRVAPGDPTTRPVLRAFVRAALFGGLAAAVVSALVQLALWLVFTDAFPAILWRDVRLTAAIALGPGVIDAPGPADWRIVASATLIHFWLSVVYAAVFAALTDGVSRRAAPVVGALLGALLYAVNLYGFTAVFPWFEVARDAITFVAHLAFGMTATVVVRRAIARDRRIGPRFID